MKELVYPAGLILIPLAYNEYIQTPKIDAHSAKLATIQTTLDAHSKILDILVGFHAASKLRQESIERAHLALEQKVAERKHMAQDMTQSL